MVPNVINSHNRLRDAVSKDSDAKHDWIESIRSSCQKEESGRPHVTVSQEGEEDEQQ